MGDIKGFMKYERQNAKSQNVDKRIKHFGEFQFSLTEEDTKIQSARCMDCGVPFCHDGCPLGNFIPDFNQAVFEGNWQKAYEILDSTNNFPEFTGRICPAPCESSCVLGINSDAVSIENIEKSIIERAFDEGWVKPKKSISKTVYKVAIVGSGPAGLACADQLTLEGHDITIFEKDDRIGGLLRYGIPDFKLSKKIVSRRIELMKEAGIKFRVNTHVGKDIPAHHLEQEFDAIVLCGGATVARDLNIEGRHLKGVHLAMEFLKQNNKRVAGDRLPEKDEIVVKDQNVLVIGGGDTGSDCIGTSHRLNAKSVTQIELMSKPPSERALDNPWPNWPQVLRVSSSQEEGCMREWSILTKRFISEDGENLSGIETVKVEWEKDEKGKYRMVENENEIEIIPCEKAFIAIGFLHGERKGLLNDLNLKIDPNGNVAAENFVTSNPKIFAAGDMRRGQSLVVWAIAEGRACAKAVSNFLLASDAKKHIFHEHQYAL